MPWRLYSSGVAVSDAFLTLANAKAYAAEWAGHELSWYPNTDDRGRLYLTGGHPPVIALDRRFGGSTTKLGMASYLRRARRLEHEVGTKVFGRRCYLVRDA